MYVFIYSSICNFHAYMTWLRQKEPSDWLQMIPCWKKCIYDLRGAQESPKNHIQMQCRVQVQQFLDKCNNIQICLMKIAKTFKYINRYFRVHQKYICEPYFFICGLIGTLNISVCTEEHFCGERHLYLNPKIHMLMLLCAFIHFEANLTPYSPTGKKK